MQASEVWIEMDNVEEGIVEMIARHGIRWLVMGAAADELYTEYASVVILSKVINFSLEWKLIKCLCSRLS